MSVRVDVECTSCGEVTERLLDDAPWTCRCGGDCRRLWTPIAAVFRCGGFYRNSR